MISGLDNMYSALVLIRERGEAATVEAAMWVNAKLTGCSGTIRPK